MFGKHSLISLAGMLAIAVLAGTASGASRSNSVTFADPAGDSGNAPDVTNVTVANDDGGKLTISIAVPNRAQLASTDMFAIALETDGNLSNGLSGVDYVLAATGSGSTLLSAQTGSLLPGSAPSLSSSFVAGVETISLNRSDLGNTSMVNLLILSSGDNGETVGDTAPGEGLWTFPVVIAPPPPPPPPPAAPRAPSTAPVSLAAGGARMGVAKAGQSFTASLTVKRADDGQAVTGKVACRASVAGKPVRLLSSRTAGTGLAACTWLVPKNARGKVLKGTITVAYQGASVTRPFTTQIR